MNRKPLMLGVLALAAFGCEQRNADTGTSSVSTAATAPADETTTATTAEADAQNAQLVRLKLPGMV